MSDGDRIDALAAQVEALTGLVGQLVAPEMQPAPVAASEPAVAPVDDDGNPDIYDPIKEKAEIRVAQERLEAVMHDANDLCAQLLPLILNARDLSTFGWMKDVLGQTDAQLVQGLLKASIVRERVNEREAKGGGGASSKNREALAERL